MPLHPAPPEDLPGLVDAFAHTLQSVVDIGSGLRDADFDLPTACPGWTVKDQLSHVVGLEAWLAGGADPSVRVPDYPWLRHDMARMLEMHVEARRSVPGPEVVEELMALIPERLAYYRDVHDPDTQVRAPWGLAPLGRMLRNRVMDVWVHEQDLREALGRPGDLDSAGAAIFVDYFFRALPRLLVKEIGVEPGSTVIFDVTGPVVGRAGARVEVGEDGEPVGRPLFTGTDHVAVEGGEAPVTTITLSTQALGRRGAGRGGIHDVHWSAAGDEDLAVRVMEGIPFTP